MFQRFDASLGVVHCASHLAVMASIANGFAIRYRGQ